MRLLDNIVEKLADKVYLKYINRHEEEINNLMKSEDFLFKDITLDKPLDTLSLVAYTSRIVVMVKYCQRELLDTDKVLDMNTIQLINLIPEHIKVLLKLCTTDNYSFEEAIVRASSYDNLRTAGKLLSNMKL